MAATRVAPRDTAAFHLARADMLRRLGRADEAARGYRSALPCAPNEHVRRFIERRLRDRNGPR
jgi:RNA polymerase sigma-70 factor (ECF subfamily)